MAIREPWPDAYVQGTTRGLPEGRDYETFCDSIADVYVGVRPSRPTRARFDADFALFDLGPLSMGYISTPGVSGHRDRSSLARVVDDSLFLNYSLGPWGLRQGGQEWQVHAKSALLLDNSEQFVVVAEPQSRLRLFSLRIPRTLLSEQVRSDVAAVDDTLSRAPIGVHVSAQMALVGEMLRTGQLSLATAMATAVVGLLNAAAERQDVSAFDRAEQCKSLARSRLADPKLDLAEIARDMGCSVRTVQGAFAVRGETFSEWLRDERLDRSWELLTVASDERTIASIAEACGFADVGTFHRGFKHRFGVTPAVAR